MTEDEMVGCHHQLIGYDFEQTWGGSILQVFENYYLTKQRIFVGKNICGDFPGGPVVGNPSANAGDKGLISSLGKSYMPRTNWAHELQLLQPTLLEPVLCK